MFQSQKCSCQDSEHTLNCVSARVVRNRFSSDFKQIKLYYC